VFERVLNMPIRKVRKLTLPKNIKKIRIRHDELSRPEVIPTLNPTVEYAEIHSNNISLNKMSGCENAIRKVPNLLQK
jgi:hypothetical protein